MYDMEITDPPKWGEVNCKHLVTFWPYRTSAFQELQQNSRNRLNRPNRPNREKGWNAIEFGQPIDATGYQVVPAGYDTINMIQLTIPCTR